MPHRDERARVGDRVRILRFEDVVLPTLQLALAGLPNGQRAALRLALVERLTAGEIAGRLRCSTREAHAALHDGLAALADVLEAVDPAISAEFDALSAPAH